MVALQQVIILFSLIVVGYIIKKLHIVKDSMKDDISSLVINVTLPAFIISSMASSFSVEILENSLTLIIISFSMYFFAIVLGLVYTKIINVKGKRRDIFRYIIAFSNCGFMGYPVVGAILGKQGVFYTAIFNLGFTTLVWTYGVYMIKSKSDRKMSIKESLKSMVTPALVAVITGFTIFILQIELPFFIKEILSMLGNVTTPLSMMLIGFILSEIHIKDIVSDKKVYLLAIARLIIMPGSVYLALNFLGITGYVLQIPVLIASMPAAANTAIIASKYGGDYQLASKGIFITTLLSIITIPIVISFIQ
ncbi:MAG: AEC family transporter [Bacillota bacterium]